ncbi:MAG TPA: flagellar biosynthetic protein FliR [Syntrophorhabdaceae bacterium]|nr:flagellar biosynthetic protein FliR [Syntrophorhabdaceae bacterium]HPL41444.1 flagellar biosynthetic protein FliR [Syntrophorhabdaceae bacterium]
MLSTVSEEGLKFIVIFFRVAAIFWFLPIFSLRSVPMPYKVGFSLCVTIVLLDVVVIDAVQIYADPYLMAIQILKEIFIGLTISYFVRTLFTVVYVAGDVAAIQTGFSFARVMDPFNMNQSSVLEQFMNLLAIMVFFAIDAHHVLLRGILLSFKELPVGILMPNKALLNQVIELTGKIFSVGFKIGAPVIVTLFLIEISLGLLSRLIPQINVFIEGMPIKILVTMMVLGFSLGAIAASVATIFKGMDMEILRIMKNMV